MAGMGLSCVSVCVGGGVRWGYDNPAKSLYLFNVAELDHGKPSSVLAYHEMCSAAAREWPVYYC